MYLQTEGIKNSVQNETTHSSLDLIRFTIENEFGIVLHISWYFIGGLVLIYLLLMFFKVRLLRGINNLSIKGYKVKFSVPGIEFEKEIERSYQNVRISNRIYIELVTRKAAVEIDQYEDVIVEVYDSWYALFQTVREEIKNIPGQELRNNRSTDNLIEITTKILNEGLRPHLTCYQSKFRKWYDEQLDEVSNKGKTPQEIQRDFPEFEELIGDMKTVSTILIGYSNRLKEFVAGKN